MFSYGCIPCVRNRSLSVYVSYTAVLDVYTLEELFELNDVTDEEALDFLVTQGFIELPRIKPLDFE